jgi:hypothetical protein
MQKVVPKDPYELLAKPGWKSVESPFKTTGSPGRPPGSDATRTSKERHWGELLVLLPWRLW